jgi:AmmeMemoRadiSam system protein B/AmmeMemoRadiSam system protein A
MGVIRPPAVAGMFYPGEMQALARDIRALFDRAEVPQGTPVPKAIIVPHAGYIYSGPTAVAAYARLAPARYTITKVVLIGPAHRVPFNGLAVSTAEAFDTPLGRIPINHDAIQRIAAIPQVGGLDQAHAQEHSLEVQLPFLQTVLDYFTLVPLVAGNVKSDTVAEVLEALWGGPETLIVISSDLSHYLDYKTARATDAGTCDAIERLDAAPIGFDQACGRIGVAGLLTVAKRRGMAVETIDLRNSGDTAGPRDRVVGYGAWAFTEPEAQIALHFDEAVRTAGPAMVALARDALETFTRTGQRIAEPASPPAVLRQPAGAFITLKRDGRLRGCIGSPTAWRPLVTDVIDNAIKAGHQDPRFPPLAAAELDGLHLSVAVLTPHEAVEFADEADLLRQLRPRIDGLLIKDGPHSALFLPAVWEQVPHPTDFMRELKRKAGLTPDHWSSNFQAWRFQAVEVK